MHVKVASTVVPVLIRVVDGDIAVHPDKVTLYKDEELEWICFDGDFSCHFNETSPFDAAVKSHQSSGGRAHAGPHRNTGRSATSHKYSVKVGAASLDPTVEADPRKRPKK